MSLTLRHIYSFDSYILDVDERVLMRDGHKVPLTPKVFETLLLLVKHQGSVVTKQKILETLWPDVFVEESNVTFNITMLRKALGDTTRHPTYIETVPRRGYRFKTEVREVLGEDIGFETPRLRVTPLPGNGERGPDLLPTLSIPENGSTAQELTSAAATSQSASSLIGHRRPAALLSVLASVLLLVGAGTIWRFAAREGKSNRRLVAPMPLSPSALTFEQVTTYGNVVSAGISPDGKQIVYVEENSGQQSLWLKQLATAVNVRIIPPTYLVYNKVTFSHDGNYIYYTQHGENESADLYRIPTPGGPPTRLVADLDSNFSLSPDDGQITFRRRNRIDRQDTLFIADLRNGQERQLITHRAPDWLWAPAWSPKGNVIVYASGETDSGRQTMSIFEVNVNTGKEKLLLKPNWYYIQQFEWLPDGDGLLICAKQEKTTPEIWEMSYPDGRLQRLTDDLNYYVSISLTSDSSKVVAVQSKLVSQVWVSPDLDPAKATNIAGGRGKLAWMPDGRIIYDYGSRSGSDLWIARSNGTEPRQLIFNSGFNDWPAVSPNGKTIVFQSDRTGAQHLWRMNADGSNQTQLTNGYSERNASFSPDGRWVYYNSSPDHCLWKIALDGGEPVKLSDDYSAYPSASPDGKLIASFRFPKYGHEAKIIIRSIADMKLVAELSLPPGFFISRTIQWDTDSALIYAIKSEGKVMLYRQLLNAGPPHELTSLKAEDEFEFALSPKHQLAYISTKWDHDIVLIDGLK
jgi:Tol biopolymer transport system component/DNA-binding winged helix-turn-helix (wHTH) protein